MAVITIVDRNENISTLLKAYFNKAESLELTNTQNTWASDVNFIFNTHVWGFREILLVMALGRKIDSTYKPSTEFYKCNPRALYEGPIRNILLDKRVPHKKSGPLNVAKATAGINKQWATQRRPAMVAEKVVYIVEKMEKFKEKELDNFLIYLCYKFLQESSRVATLAIEVAPEADPINLYRLCRELTENVPDLGNTPQKIVGFLLSAYHEDLQTGIKIVGYLDSASVTSTTSKKPGDISEEQLDGTLIKVYEITVKPFGQARVIESYDTVRAYRELNNTNLSEIIVICRKQDAPIDLLDIQMQDGIFIGRYNYSGIEYYFTEIFNWIAFQLIKMSADARLAFYNRLQEYISNPNTSEKVKVFWRHYHLGKS